MHCPYMSTKRQGSPYQSDNGALTKLIVKPEVSVNITDEDEGLINLPWFLVFFRFIDFIWLALYLTSTNLYAAPLLNLAYPSSVNKITF